MASQNESRNKSQDKKLYLVDGTSQLFRAYFALPGLTNADGLPTNAVYGFTSMLRKLLADEQPTYLAVAFDPPGPTFRKHEFAEYKANRPPAPQDLNVQVPYAKQACTVLGVPVVELSGFEADDVIATYATRARAASYEVVVVASDKDLLQLVGTGVTVLNPSKNVRLDADGVTESFGVPPVHVRDVLGLMGDSVDNIPGVPGVGQKTALAVVSTYGEIEAAIDRAGRFVAVYDTRDELLAALDVAAAQSELEAQAAARVRELTGRMVGALDGLIELERDAELERRWVEIRQLLEAPEIAALGEAVGGTGRAAVKPLRELKRALKAMTTGSSRRAWTSIHEHADQARLSRRLATLDTDAPLELGLEALVLDPPDRDAASALFDSLGFRALSEEFAKAPGDDAPAPVEVEKTVYETVSSADRLREKLATLGPEVALDAVGEGARPLRADLVGVALSGEAGRAFFVPAAAAGGLAAALTVSGARWVGHDLKRTAHLLQRADLGLGGSWFDTQVAAFLLNPGRTGYSLDRLAQEFLGHRPEPVEAPAAKAAPGLFPDEPDPEAVALEACERADRVGRLARRLAALLDEAGLAELYADLDGPLLPLLARMERHGIRIDVELLAQMAGEMSVALDRTRAEIHELAGVEFNVDSPKQLANVLFEQLGLKSRRKTPKSGVASTDAQTLEALADEHEIARKILSYRELAKLKGTYVDTLPRLVDPDTGRVHTCYHPTGAATGRLSSSDPNLQNIPARTEAGRRIRAAFVADPGHVFLASDYSQVELRILAHLCEDEGLIEAFRAGEDIHRHTAALVFGVAAPAVTATMRQRAKAVNFGILYGMSETRLAREQGMSRTEARAFIAAYFERFARVRSYIDGVREQARRDGAVRTLFGRVRLFPQLHQRMNRAVQEQALRAAVNTTIQGTAADLMKQAMLRVDAALAEAGSPARMLLQVHDELLLEVPQDRVGPTGDLVRAAMEGVHPLKVPLAVELKTGTTWEKVT